MIREIQDSDYDTLAQKYAHFFPVHSIFSQDADVIKAYLRKEALEREQFLVCEENGAIKGALILVLKGKSKDNKHTRWKFRHIIFDTLEAGTALIEEAEMKVRDTSMTAKVELTLAENEKHLEFFEQMSYAKEGELENHYRWDEKCIVLGKSFS